MVEDDEDELPPEIAQRFRNHKHAVSDEMEYTTIDNDVTTPSEAPIVRIVSEVRNSNAARSNDKESDGEFEIQTVTQEKSLKALCTVRCFLRFQKTQKNILNCSSS